MRTPTCRDHGTLVFELALGRLDDRTAAEAEQARENCPACRGWWNEQLAGESVAEVERAVDRALAGFAPPRRRASRAWLAAAAAVVLAASAGLLWRATRDLPPPPQPPTVEMVRHVFDATGAVEGDLTGDGVVDASDISAALHVSTSEP